MYLNLLRFARSGILAILGTRWGCPQDACGALGRKPRIFRHLRRFVTTTGEKVRLIWNDLLSSGVAGSRAEVGGGRPEATDESGFFDDESL